MRKTRYPHEPEGAVPAVIIIATGRDAPRFVVQYRRREPPDPMGDAFARVCFFAESAPDETFDDWDRASAAAREWIDSGLPRDCPEMLPREPEAGS